MPQIISTTVYQYDELPTEQAKEKARNWYNEGNDDSFWADFVLEYWKNEKLPAMGFYDAEISYSGFCSQGDGASFTANIDFLKYCKAFNVALPKLLKKRLEKGTVQVWGKIERNTSHYSHENTVSMSYPEIQVNEGSFNIMRAQIQSVWLDIIKDARQTMREIYRELEKAYDSETSEENTAENIRANGYTFTESGKRFG